MIKKILRVTFALFLLIVGVPAIFALPLAIFGGMPYLLWFWNGMMFMLAFVLMMSCVGLAIELLE